MVQSEEWKVSLQIFAIKVVHEVGYCRHFFGSLFDVVAMSSMTASYLLLLVLAISRGQLWTLLSLLRQTSDCDTITL